MKVYAVIGGLQCEGEDFNSLGLFDCLSTANDYVKFLKEDGYDYILMETREVDMKSAICAA